MTLLLYLFLYLSGNAIHRRWINVVLLLHVWVLVLLLDQVLGQTNRQIAENKYYRAVSYL